ncbi:MAG: hypothetical protein ACK4OF_03765 [Aquificaceae bacterium]
MVGIYRFKKEYSKAFSIYKLLYDRAQDHRKKASLYREIIILLLEGEDYSNLKAFIKENYANHLYDTELLKLTLRASLATGDPEFAYMISKDIARLIR